MFIINTINLCDQLKYKKLLNFVLLFFIYFNLVDVITYQSLVIVFVLLKLFFHLKNSLNLLVSATVESNSTDDCILADLVIDSSN